MRRPLLLSGLLLLLCGAGPLAAQQASFSHRLDAAPRRAPRAALRLPDTVRVLAVMAEFQADDDSRSTGTGKFGSVYPQDFGKNILDPLPHDRAHFQNHLRFLANYVAKVSGGATAVTSEVLDGVVTLPNQMGSYSPRAGQSDKPVADLAVQAWTAADKQFPNVDFSRYDFFIVFHAGIGRDINLASIQGYTPNPYDVPSLYIGLEAMRGYYGAQYAGIPMKGGAQVITNSAVIPCTETRITTDILGQTILLNLTINGLIAACFGNWAGLPDLYDTKTGNTGIGRFGLMDGQSIFSWGGICPPEPNAWEKQFLGWASPRPAAPGRREYLLTAHRTDQLTTSDVVRVPVTESEYWLLENRQRDPAGDGEEVTMISDGQTVKMRFARDQDGFNSGDLKALRGVVIDVEDVDWMLPGGTVIGDSGKSVFVGGGILIWHIDETIIDANLATNTVNADKRNRGVDLEQAAGPQDIGEEQQSPFGTTIGEGTPLDYFFQGNISPLYKNAFNAGTFPPARTNKGYASHVAIDHFSPQGAVMSCEIALGDNSIAPLPGFPVKLFAGTDKGLPLRRTILQSADLDNDGLEEFVVVSGGRNPVGIVKSAGRMDDPETDSMYIVRQSGLGFFSADPSAAVQSFPQQNVRAFLLTHVTGGPEKEIVIQEARRGDVTAYAPADANGDGRVDSIAGWRMSAAGGASAIVGLPDGFAMFRSFDTLMTYRSGIERILTGPKPVDLGTRSDLAWFGGPDRLLSTYASAIPSIRQGEIISLSDNARTIFGLPGGILDAPRVGKLKQDADYHIAAAGSGSVFGCAISGLLTGFPAALEEQSALPFNTLADVDGDGKSDIVAATASGVDVINYAGARIDHYPAAQGSGTPRDASHRAYALAARLSADPNASLFYAGYDFITILDARGKSIDGFPMSTAPNPEYLLFTVGSANPTLGLALIGDDGYLYAYDLHVPMTPKTLVWRAPSHDEMNSNCLPDDASSAIPFSEFFPDARCYNWPNPAYGSSTKIRFYVSKDADVTVKIYDIAGAKVDELHAKAAGGTDNEIDWNISAIQSGVYLAHVEAQGGGEQGVKIVKVAVVK